MSQRKIPVEISWLIKMELEFQSKLRTSGSFEKNIHRRIDNALNQIRVKLRECGRQKHKANKSGSVHIGRNLFNEINVLGVIMSKEKEFSMEHQ
jgi:hypothetical protein